MTKEEKEAALHCLRAMIDEEVCEECPLYGTTGTDHCEKDCVRFAIQALEQKPICPSAGIDCEDCPAHEDTIGRYQKIKQMLYEFKEMPLAPCLMKGHICAVHEILNEVIDPFASSSEKPNKSEWQQDHEILKAYSDGANAVLDNIRVEIGKQSRMHMDGDLYIKASECMQIIDKYKAEGSEKE